MSDKSALDTRKPPGLTGAKALTTEELREVNEESYYQWQYNRALEWGDLEAVIDPDGKHILLDNGLYRVGSPHNGIRVEVNLKMRGTMKPSKTVMDIHSDTWARLTPAVAYLDAIEEIEQREQNQKVEKIIARGATKFAKRGRLSAPTEEG